MKLIFLGPPGVGKGTQAGHVCEHYGIIHLSTGDMLRSEIKDSSEVGRVAKSYIYNGALVADIVLLDNFSTITDSNFGSSDFDNKKFMVTTVPTSTTITMLFLSLNLENKLGLKQT